MNEVSVYKTILLVILAFAVGSGLTFLACQRTDAMKTNLAKEVQAAFNKSEKGMITQLNAYLEKNLPAKK